jgi:HD-GYP domain-containing protein (c-di-GMP phosphodiesterase class II)
MSTAIQTKPVTRNVTEGKTRLLDKGTSNIPLFDLVTCLSGALDLVSQALADHHRQVAYIALSIAREYGLSEDQQEELVLAGALHDVGLFSLKEKLEARSFELEEPYRHAELGYLLLRVFEPFSDVATLVRFHHVPWDGGSGSHFKGMQVPIGSHILHLADRTVVLINRQQEVLGQVTGIVERIEQYSGKLFMPELVNTFKSLSQKDYIWLDVASPSIGSTLLRVIKLPTIELDVSGLLSLAKFFSHVIDFRSRFTATHSSGVAATAELLAKLAGFSERECQMMKVAGYLHDLGKLAVPAEILEKPAKLTVAEFNVIRSHTFHTYRTLEALSDLDIINAWASFHHERLDGSGYPFHLRGQDLPLGARLMAVADVFTAITEDRPYRKGMTSDAALQVLQQMADNSALDPSIVSLLELHFDEVDSARISAQAAAVKEYEQVLKGTSILD